MQMTQELAAYQTVPQTEQAAEKIEKKKSSLLVLLFWQSVFCAAILLFFLLLPNIRADWQEAIGKAYRQAIQKSFTAVPGTAYTQQSGLILLPESAVQEDAGC